MLGDNVIEDALHRLNKLIDEEHRMTTAKTFEGVHRLNQNVKQVIGGEQISFHRLSAFTEHQPF
jgi:hypothetical protein